MSKMKRILCALLSVCLLSFPIGAAVTSVSAADSEEEVQSLQDKLDALAQKNQEYQAVIDKTQEDINEKEAYNEALTNKINTLDEKISLTRESIGSLNSDIKATKKEIKKSNREIDDQVDALCERLRAIYMAGSASDLEIILGAKDFSDLIDKMTLVKTLSKYDNELIEKINTKLGEITEKKKKLEKDKKELEKKEDDLSKDVSELNKTLEQNRGVLQNLQVTNENARSKLASNDSKKAQIEAEIAQYFADQAEKARKAEEERLAREAQAEQEAEGNGQETEQDDEQDSSSETKKKTSSQSDDEENSHSSYNDDEDDDDNGGSSPSYYTPSPSGYTWPCPGFYELSSEWNEDRDSYNHGAIDISESGIMDASVVAAADGTVMYTCDSCSHNYGKDYSCGCGGGYGNYVWIDHGNGKETIYAHLSSVYVNEGDEVSAGQVIGTVGSTGWSTGEHLHFECRYNGEQYDPMSEF